MADHNIKLQCVLEDYSTLTIDHRVKCPSVLFLYQRGLKHLIDLETEAGLYATQWSDFKVLANNGEWAIKGTGNSRQHVFLREFAMQRMFYQLLPKRGIVLSHEDFGEWLRTYAVEYEKDLTSPSIRRNLTGGPGFSAFRYEQSLRWWLKEPLAKIRREDDKTAEIGFLMNGEPGRPVPLHRLGFFSKNTHRPLGAFYLDLASVADENDPRYPYITELSDRNLCSKYYMFAQVAKEDIMSVTAGDFLLPFQMCTFGVMIYGIYDLVTGKWIYDDDFFDMKIDQLEHHLPAINYAYASCGLEAVPWP